MAPSAGLAVRDMDETLKYWNGVLGLDLQADKAFANDDAMLDLMGPPRGASCRMAGGLFSGSQARLEVIEVKGVPASRSICVSPMPMRAEWPFASATFAKCLPSTRPPADACCRAMAKLVEWSDTIRNVFVKDPNGLNLELVGGADPNQ